MAHTPGPWQVCCGMVETTNDGPDCGNGHRAIPIAYMHRETPHTRPTERDANARLIAAAPDMLGAIRDLLYMIEGEDCWARDERDIITDRARAILARINGD